MKRIIGRISFLFILILSLGLISCDSWMTGDNFFDQIADEVKYANAEKIKVFIRYPNRNMGETSPNGSSNQKVDIPFTVTAVDSSNYAFYKWAAFKTQDFPTTQQHNILYTNETAYEQYKDKELGTDEVVFEDPREAITTVRVLHERNDVFIMPICVRRPYLVSSNPSNGQQNVVKNQAISLVFSQPMKIGDLINVNDPENAPLEGNLRDYKVNEDDDEPKIHVSYVQGYGTENVSYYDDLITRLCDSTGAVNTNAGLKLKATLHPSHKTLLIRTPDGLYWPSGATISVRVSRDVNCEVGDREYEMADDEEFIFNVGTGMDDANPTVGELEVGFKELKRNPATGTNYERVSSNLNVRAYILDKTKSTDINETEASVSTVYWLLYYMAAPSSSLEAPDGVGSLKTDGTHSYSSGADFSDNPKANLTSSQRSSGLVFSIDKDHLPGYDGLFKILVYGQDNAGNTGNHSTLAPVHSTNTTAAESKYIYFIKDTQAPNISPSQVVATSTGDSAPYGWFNSTTISNITIKPSSTSPIKDLPDVNNRYRSDKVWWIFYMGSETGAEAWDTSVKMEDNTGTGGWGAWHEVTDDGNSLSELIGSTLNSSSITEGNVPLYVKFRDDVGNISDLVSLDAIKFDGTAPTLGNLSWTSKNSSVAPGIADSNILGNQQLVVPFTENLSGIKKIQITVVNPDGEEYPTPFRNTDFAIRTSPSGELLPGSVDATDGTYYIFNTPVLTTFTSLYIDNLKISESSTLAEGNYTVKVKLFDAALNETAEKTISLYADRTNPEITEMYFDGVKNDSINNSYAGSILLNPENTYTTSSTGNTLFIKMTETGSGIQKIDIPYGFATNPYAPSGSASQIPRGIIPTTSTKLFVSTNGGTSYTEVPCSVDTASKCLTIAQDNAIRGTDVLLKITNITLSGTPGTVEALVGAVLRDFAGHANSAVKYAAVAEDYSAPEVSSVSIGDSGKHLNGSNALVNDTGISAQSGYTDTPIVNIVARLNEYATDAAVTTCSGLRKIVLEGASFTSNTEIEVCQNISVSYNNYPVNSWRYIHSLGTKDSVEDCPFAYSIPTDDTTSGGGFYIVDDHTAVLRIPLNITADYPFSIRYVKLDDTASDGEKTVKISFFDTARQLETTASNQKTMKIKYCATAPTIKVNDASGTDPEAITAANIQTLVPKNNGLQVYADAMSNKAWVYSHDTQNNRNGTNTTPSGSGVYISKENCPYFNLKITSSDVAKPKAYAWTYDSADIPASESSEWSSTDSSYRVNVTFPTSGDISGTPAEHDLYLHVADYAGNVTTKQMSTFKWINETVSSAWPKRNTTGDGGTKMEPGVYYLEASGLYTYGGKNDPKFTVTFPAGTTGTKKIYIPTSWFDKVCTNGAPIYGYALGTHTRLGDGHADIDCAKVDGTGPYLELPDSFYISDNNKEIYFYVYDAVGNDLTCVVNVVVDATPPVLELGVLRDSGEYPSGTSSGMKTKWEGSSYVNSTKTRFNVESDGSRHIRETVSSTQQSTTKGASETDPIVLYVDTNNPEIMLWTNSMDVLKFTCSVNGAAASEIAIDQTTSTSTDLNTNYVRISPTLTETGAMYKFSAVDKGANESSIYIKAYWDNAGPTVSLTNATNIYTNPTDHKNYIASINEATASTATITITDQLVGFGSGEKTLTYNSAKLLDYLTVDNTANTLKLKTTYQADALGNANTASISYNGSSSWELDNAAPIIQIVPGSMTGCATIDGYLYISASNSNAKLKLNITEYGSGLASGSIQDQEEITLSNYVSDGVVKIPNPSNSNSKPVIDNVGNGYTTANPYLPGLSIRLDDKSPNPPASLVDASSTGGTLIRDGTTITYNGSTTAITLNITTPADPNNTDGTAGSGVAGYTASSGVTVTASDSTSITIAPVAGTFPSTVTIKSKDGVGNVSSSGLTVTLIKDEDAPEIDDVTYPTEGVVVVGDKIYFKGSPTITLSISDDGCGLDGNSWGNGKTITITDTYYDSDNHTLKIPINTIYDKLGNSSEYVLSDKIYRDDSAPAIQQANFAVQGTAPYVGRVSASSSTPVTWYKDDFKVCIKNSETDGCGLAYWQIGTSYTKDAGTFVSGTAENEFLALPNITSASTLYFYVEDKLGNNNYGVLSSINTNYADYWLKNPGGTVTPPVIGDVTGITATVGASTSSNYIHRDGNSAYYNGAASAVTISMTVPNTNIKGYNLTGSNADPISSTTLTPTLSGDSTEISIYAFDYAGNSSTPLTLTFLKDSTAPTFNSVTYDRTLTTATTANPSNGNVGHKVNAFPSGTKVTIGITESGSGLAGYALVKTTSLSSLPSYSWTTDVTGNSIEVTLPDTDRYDTNFVLLLKDKVGNVTQPTSGDYAAAALADTMTSDTKWWSSIPASPSFTASSTVNGNDLTINLSGVYFPVKKIQVTAAAAGGLNGNVTFKHSGEGNYNATVSSSSNGTVTLNTSYISFDGTITFTLTGGEGLGTATEIKLNDSVTWSVGGNPSFFAGFNRFRFGETDATEIRAANTQEAQVRLTRNISVGDFFAAMDSPAYAESDNRVAFSVGKNMDAVVEGKKQEETVTVQEEFGYNNVASDAENLPLQNLSWHAPDGPILEDAGQEEEALALNLSPEFNSSNQVLSASDAGNPQEESHGWNPALVVSLLAMLALGLVALCVRKRPVR